MRSPRPEPRVRVRMNRALYLLIRAVARASRRPVGGILDHLARSALAFRLPFLPEERELVEHVLILARRASRDETSGEEPSEAPPSAPGSVAPVSGEE